MQSDFSTAGKTMRENLSVPSVPMTAILQRSAETNVRNRLRAVIGTVVIGLGLASAWAVAAKLAGIDFWLNGDKAQVRIHSLELITSPRLEDLRGAVANATFRIVYPVGLPSDVKLARVFVSPKGAPSSVSLDYTGASGFHAGFSIFDASTVNATQNKPALKSSDVDSWRVGDEVVIVPKGQLRSSEIAAIKDAMLHTTPEASAADAEGRLTTMRMVDTGFRLGTALKYAPKGGDNALIEDVGLDSMASLIAKGQPLHYHRFQSINGLQYKNGAPDFGAPRQVEISQDVLLDVAGMRAVESVLHDRPCKCYVLVNHQGATYRIWTFPAGPSGTIKHYEVGRQP